MIVWLVGVFGLAVLEMKFMNNCICQRGEKVGMVLSLHQLNYRLSNFV